MFLNKQHKMNEMKKKQLLKDLNELKDITELPSLYLTDYFSGLRNEVDKIIVSKQMSLQDEDEKKNELNHIWQLMTAIINTFEIECINSRFDLSSNITRINLIEAILSDSIETTKLLEIEEMIENEDIKLMQNLFQNKSIAFINVRNFLEESKIGILYAKLIVLHDESIRPKALKIR